MPTPLSGTFRLLAGAIQSKTEPVGSDWQDNNTGDTTDAGLIGSVNKQSPFGASGLLGQILGPGDIATIQFDTDTTQIILNQGTVDEEILSFAGLPAGFTAQTATLNVWVRNQTGQINQIFFRHNVLSESAAFGVTDTGVEESFPYTFPITMLSIVNNGWGFKIQDLDIGSVVFIGLDDNGDGQQSTVTGTYLIISSQFSWTMDPASGSEVDPEETIEINSDPNDPNALNLEELTLSVDCGIIVPIVQTPNQLIFTVPASCNDNGSTMLIATGNGVQFTGQITLGTLMILLADASGIYRLVKDKTNDTLYSGARDGSTFDVKIPNPRFRTGFIDG